jgi:hypothetical protein
MKQQLIQTELEQLAALAGVSSCGLVEVQAGMAWCSAGDATLATVTESATDYWRLTLRQSETFGPLGELRAQVVMHANARVTSVGCPGGLLLVCVSEEPDRVDWPAWKAGVARLRQVLAPVVAPAA